MVDKAIVGFRRCPEDGINAQRKELIILQAWEWIGYISNNGGSGQQTRQTFCASKVSDFSANKELGRSNNGLQILGATVTNGPHPTRKHVLYYCWKWLGGESSPSELETPNIFIWRICSKIGRYCTQGDADFSIRRGYKYLPLLTIVVWFIFRRRPFFKI